MAGTIKVKLLKSTIGCTKQVKDTVRGLGLLRIRHVSELENTACVRGMIRKVQHMVDIVD